MVKLILNATLFAALVLAGILVLRWLVTPEKKASGVGTLEDLGDEVDQSVKQFDETKQKVADAEEKVREMKEKTDK